jgi:para-nitrobenzyl esterase
VPFLDDVLGTRYGELPGSEDCQNLSITVPADLAPGELLPVMVWIHGGSYTTGSGDLAIFDPAVLVAETRVVVVSVTYRLGLFGFLATHSGRPGNLGLLDQLEAFRWVQRNVAAFGGDPAASPPSGSPPAATPSPTSWPRLRRRSCSSGPSSKVPRWASPAAGQK